MTEVQLGMGGPRTFSVQHSQNSDEEFVIKPVSSLASKILNDLSLGLSRQMIKKQADSPKKE